MNKLQALELEEIETLPTEQFKIENLDSLNWAFRKITAIDTELGEINALADAEMQRIKQWHEAEKAKITRSREFFEGLIIQYAAVQKAENPKFKASTPYGKVSFRKQQPKWNYNDEQLIMHLLTNGLHEMVRTKQEPDKTAIKKAFQVNEDGMVFDSNGEQVQGITIEFLPEQLVIKVGE